MRSGIFDLLAKFFRLFFFLVHFLFPKGDLRISTSRILWAILFAHPANFIFATVNEGITIRTTKFHSLDFFQTRQSVPRISLRMGQRERERISGVRRGRFRQIQKPLHHFCHGGFLCRTITDDGQFTLRGAISKISRPASAIAAIAAPRASPMMMAVFRFCAKNNPSIAQTVGWYSHNLAERLGNFGQTARVRPRRRTGNRPVRQGFGKRFRQLDDAIARAAQRRINAEDDLW